MAQRFSYLRDYTTSNKRPVGCLAVEIDKLNKQIRYAFSACSPLDNFNAEIAKAIAGGKLKKRPVIIECNVPDAGHDISQIVMTDIIAKNSAQGKGVIRSYLACMAAQSWLDHSKVQRAENA